MPINDTDKNHFIGAFLAQRAGGCSENFVPHFERVMTAIAAGNTVVAAENAIADGALIVTADAAKKGAVAPLVSDGTFLWLYRLWFQEWRLASCIQKKLNAADDSILEHNSFDDGLNAEQKQALKMGLTRQLSIINGGPGTGKTFTVARIVAALLARDPDLTIALAAPTGKAAQRLEIALHQAFITAQLTRPTQLTTAQTVHRLLGVDNTGTARYHEHYFLPYDVVIIDEASMLSLELAAQLFQALAPHTRIILLGDAQQLAAVEAGAVLHDLAQQSALNHHVVTLQESRRFHQTSGIGILARCTQSASQTALTAALEHEDIALSPLARRPNYDRLYEPYRDYVAKVAACAAVDVLLQQFDNYRILTKTRYGAYGTAAVNEQMKKRHLAQMGVNGKRAFYQGAPVMVTRNNYAHGVFNGDIGICLADERGQMLVYFREDFAVPLLFLKDVLEFAYALTIHKAQGSEFEQVALLLDKQEEGLTRELVYTGITRAKKQLWLETTPAILLKAMQTPTQRLTGLSTFFKI